MKKLKKITQFTPGSLREFMVMALPLIMVALSENIMIFFDRVILSHYSLDSLNAVTLASQTIEMFQFGLWAVASIAELFVARSYAQNQLKEMATPCWQMIYLSIMLIPFFVLLANFTGTWILPVEYRHAGMSYYTITMYSIPLIGIITALSSFFVGQGKTKLILYSTIVINVINLGLDFLLIFGYDNIVPALGAKGAAISVIVSLSIQVIWLLLIYLNKHHRHNFATHKFYFNWKYFSDGIRIGFPVALSQICELAAWIFIIKMIAKTGTKNFTIVSIGSTMYLIVAFVNDGLYRTLSTIISNHIAAKNFLSIPKTLRSSVIFFTIFIILFAIPIFFFPQFFIRLFNLSDYAAIWLFDIRISLIFMWGYFLFSGIYWIFSAVLTARYHTKFVMINNIFSIWLLTVLPIYLLVTYHKLVTLIIWPLIMLSTLCASLLAFIYYRLHIVKAIRRHSKA